MSELPPPNSAPAGWYTDPYGGGRRYFDGREWVGEPVPVTPQLAERRDAHPSLPAVAAWGALLVLTVSLVASKLVVDGLVGNDWPLIVYIVIASVLAYGPSIGWVVYVRRRWGEGRFRDLGWRFRWSDLGWGPLTWLVAVVTQALLALLILLIDIPFASNIEAGGEGTDERTYIVALLVAAVIAAPLVEEIVFRGLVMRGFLSAMHPAVAIGLQGLLFGVAHVDPVRGVGNIGLALVLSGVGVVLGGAAYLFRRIGPVVLAHAILNAVALTLALTGVLDDIDSPFDAVFLLGLV